MEGKRYKWDLPSEEEKQLPPEGYTGGVIWKRSESLQIMQMRRNVKDALKEPETLVVAGALRMKV